ncbi:MG2 domain-containing protein [Prevotella sp. E13-17]|uniref:alpha-2-macroglobulin family protein n=1 Tax=Prevotella sp. E13-17 TaxID=2913616 RepID=UPI001EDBF4FB|nr:alpha-2-macroglobulin family protein [Prevotella sp. E13-17]UKK51581.1 MG2 domain-containing protein [Prevotella sp. E13-17]
MKKYIMIAAILLMASTNCLYAQSKQTYNTLWKQVNDAEDKDLPRTQITILQKIAKKAEREKDYGHLLKAELSAAKALTAISTDSLKSAIERLEACEQKAEGNWALQAVYDAVLVSIYENNALSFDEARQQAAYYREKALSHPAILAATKVTGYTPFIIKEKDSRFFDDDLLSVIGYETDQTKVLHKYYLTTTNRKAQLLTAIKGATIEQLDSLMALYGDLDVCGEAAISRYQQMRNAEVSDRIAYIDKALQRWGSWPRMNELRNARMNLTREQFTVNVDKHIFIPNREQKITIKNLRGINQLAMHIYKVNANGDISLTPNNTQDYEKIKPLLTATPFNETRNYTDWKDYELQNDTVTLPGLPAGVYLIEFNSQPQTANARILYFVSDVRLLSQGQPNNRMRFVVVNATTGQPITGASVRLITKEQSTTLTTNAQGECYYHFKQANDAYDTKVFASTKDDRFCPCPFLNRLYDYQEYEYEGDKTAIMTDRAIYRPGQKVHMAAIIYHVNQHNDQRAAANKQVTVTLYDANHRVLTEKQLVTDAFGTVSADFNLPVKGLTGNYHIRIGNEYHYFRVEEYKRPTFQVEFPKVEQDYKAGDTLTIKATAKSYAGIPVQNAHVTYRVERRRAWWWFADMAYWSSMRFGNDIQDETILTGESTTDANGHFEVRMPLVMPATEHPLFCNFIVTADVTDMAGETHHGELSVPLGNRKTALSIDIEDKLLIEKMQKPTLHLKNAAGNDLIRKVRYQLDRGKWKTIETCAPIILPRLKSGKHTLRAEYEDEIIEKSFIVFSLNDKKPAEETDEWFYLSDGQFPNDGTPVTLQIGSSAKDVHIIYTIASGIGIIEQGSVDKSNALINRKLTYKPEYGDGLSLSYVWVKDGLVYRYNFSILRPTEDKKLNMTWETFRDRLTPGQQEEWTLKVEPTSADGIQLMATLFDKSLDQLAMHNWNFMPYTNYSLPILEWSFSEGYSVRRNATRKLNPLKVDELALSHFDSSCYPSMWYPSTRRPFKRGLHLAEEPLKVNSNADTYECMESNYIVTGSGSTLNGRIAGLDIKQKTASSEESSQAAHATEQVSMRENLQETAFFYPQMMADSTGIFTLKFTLPESLTSWRFIGLAHTKDLRYGLLEGEAVAKKDVMIQPNLPRFIRMGDEATISARIFNTSDHDIEGVARLELLDPETMQVLYSDSRNTLVPANATFGVTFPYVCRHETQGLVVAKLSFTGEGFSDGEQHYLPILPNKEQMTVTIPFTQTAPGTKTIDLAAMIPTDATQARLTFEYTNNPAWLMIQALPTVAHANDQCAICQATALYANTLGRHILGQNPQAKHVFETWKQENGEETSLTSALEKNEALKDLVLNETPWVADARSETEQKRQLADFFDSSLMDYRITSAINQLSLLQKANGSWSWWPGMNGSFFITVEVSEMLVRLNQMAGEQADTKKMLAASFTFMDQEILKMVDEMKKEEKKGHRQSFPSFKALQYLYMSKISGRKPTAKVEEAQSYLKKLLKKDVKSQSIYEKALAAIILNAPAYIKSLKEYTVYKEDMGRYYDTPRAGYSWRDYRIPTQVAVIEALQKLTPADTTTIDQMRRWLLQQKRTQAWDTPINSVNAIYAFLNAQDNQGILDSPSMPTTLRVDEKLLDHSKATAGLGYVKVSHDYHGQQTFTAEKTSAGTSWGAVYAQFMQPTTSIQPGSSEISVKRELIGHQPLKVGDRIKVRITINAARDFDFVEVIDKRAACMEPVNQLSGFRNGYYCAPKDNATHYYFDRLPKGKHVIETEYYIDRLGTYETGALTAGCAYAPEFRGQTASETIIVK